ncbi:Clavaminate synthase-like protein [Lentinula raphanica]|nr:Clavaminate synthase-like protein [Lentinula raphanica]
MPVPAYPEFPANVPSHPLLVVDYDLIKKGDKEEIDVLWKAATTLGFWYMKNHGAEEDVNGMFDMGAETMELPLEEKMKYEQGNEGSSFGYKYAGANAVNADGEPDKNEFINIAKDDALAWPKQARRSYPSTVNNRMENTIIPFVKKSVEINNTILGVFNAKLGLPEGTLQKLHSLEEYSGSEARTIKAPKNLPAGRQALGAHTDFGSLSFLHNRLGGLQVLPPGVDEWQYVKPMPGHAICNVGDALALLSGGILHSNIHRVFPPPGAQAGFDRWSQVFFTRPGNSVVLRPLSDQSAVIAEAVGKLTEEQRAAMNPGATALEWFNRRLKNQRLKNRKGPETWLASRGTEQGRV